MKIFYINVDERKDRNSLIKQQLLKFDIKATRFSAITPKRFNLNLLKKKFNIRISPGEIACVLSHKSIWEEVINKNLPYAMVLEDDIIISRNFKKAIKLIEPLINKCPLIKIETGLDSVYFGRPYYKLQHSYSVKRIHSNTTGTAGYIINHSLCKELIQYKRLLEQPIDHTMFYTKNYCFNKELVFQLSPGVVIRMSNFMKDEISKVNFNQNILTNKKLTNALRSDIESERTVKAQKKNINPRNWLTKKRNQLENFFKKIFLAAMFKRSFFKKKIKFN